MVFVLYHREQAQSRQELEGRLAKLGWVNFRWCPSPKEHPGHGSDFFGRSPNYTG